MEKTLAIPRWQDVRIQQTKQFIDEGVSISQGTYRTVNVHIIMMPQVRQNLIEQRTALNLASGHPETLLLHAGSCSRPQVRSKP